MKNALKVLALVMVVTTLCLTFASCGKLSGKYATEEVLGSSTTLEFKGSKVTVTFKLLSKELAPVEGKYSIKDDEITFTFDAQEDEDLKTALNAFAKPVKFEKDGDTLKIGGVSYKKAK